MAVKPVKLSPVFYPRTMGVFVFLSIILSFAAGAIRRELVLTMTGAAFLAIWAYCLVMTLLLALLHRRRAAKAVIRLSPDRVVCGGWTQVTYLAGNEIPLNKNIFQLPGILVRCRVLLRTNDGRRITYDFKPADNTGLEKESFLADKRGAYFSPYDEFACFDILGFFRFAFRLPTDHNARLLVSPRAARESPPVRARGGDENRKDSPPTERSEELIDNRPYVPGDDPRRINWKLYSHGGELYVRQGEREPPPLSSLTILIDTYCESGTRSAARAGVDLLCETALAIIQNAGKDRDIQIGFTGHVKTPADSNFFLAYPAALHISKLPIQPLPKAPKERGIIILALPRTIAGTSALDLFLSENAGRSSSRPIDLFFIYGTDEKDQKAAGLCENFYNKRQGVRAFAHGFLSEGAFN
jgi:hypothetical protein